MDKKQLKIDSIKKPTTETKRKKKLKRKEKTLEERVLFLEKAHKKRVKFKSLLMMYKYVKDIYAAIKEIKDRLTKLEEK